MSEANDWKVYYINDCDWFLARSLQEAKRCYLDVFGGDPEGSDDAQTSDAREMTPREMEETKYYEVLPNDIQRCRTFQEELERRIAAGITGPELFATTEF